MQHYNAFGEKPFEKRVGEAGMIGAIARWCEFLHKQAPLRDALGQLAEGMGAEAIVLSRVSRQHGGENSVLLFDKTSGHSKISMVDRSFARAILGPYFDKPKPGSIWLKSALESEIDPALSRFHRRRNLNELAIIPLATGEKKMDFIEIHFPFKLQFDHHALLNMVADTLARTWKNRMAGLVTECFLQAQARPAKEVTTAPILSMENPARLSRAEYRVCLLLSRGLTVEKVQHELSVSLSTLRTHLKNIYSKTHTSGQSELMFHLLTLSPVADEPVEKRRIA